jgi:hypothetical protein
MAEPGLELTLSALPLYRLAFGLFLTNPKAMDLSR